MTPIEIVGSVITVALGALGITGLVVSVGALWEY
jgi:hypothetical protein